MWELYLANVQVAGVITAAGITALGTLIAGGAAVYGAWRVGRKQTEVSGRQADIQREMADIAARQADIQREMADIAMAQNSILSGQLDLEKQRAKADLFDRRMLVYTTARTWIDETVKLNDMPAGDLHRDFTDAIQTSAFLFSPTITDFLNELYDLAIPLRFQMNKREQDRDGDKVLDAILQLADYRKSIQALFVAEMGLHRS